MIDPDNWKYIISIEGINDRRKTILPMLILCNILNLEKWAEENDFDKNILLATSLKGYSNELALQWLEHFKIHNWKSQVGIWRLLIINGYKLHFTYRFYKYT